MYEKLKSLLLDDRFFFSLIVFLVAIGSFGLGRASVTVSTDTKERFQLLDSNETSAQQEKSSEVANSTYLDETIAPRTLVGAISTTTPEGKKMIFVASKSGTKYHLLSCPGAKQIKEENKIYFDDRQAAEAAGYKPAANCPTLQ